MSCISLAYQTHNRRERIRHTQDIVIDYDHGDTWLSCALSRLKEELLMGVKVVIDEQVEQKEHLEERQPCLKRLNTWFVK